jgi:hypothetical protein
MRINVGFEGETNFQVSLLGQQLLTFTQDCLAQEGSAQCSEPPNFAQNYLDGSNYYQEGENVPFILHYSGYET